MASTANDSAVVADTGAKPNDAAQKPILLSNSASKKSAPEGVHIAYIPLTVRFLDETPSMEITIDKLTKGQELLDRVCEHLQLFEKGYFGLRFDGADNERYWVDLQRSVHKQLKQAESRIVHFRVRYYPAISSLREEITRYQFFLQLRRDLFRGRLLCPLSDAYELAALILQSEVGDYDAELCKPGYVSEFPLLPRQNSKLEERIAEMHKTMVGMTPAEAESRLLKLASRFDTYGVDPFAVRAASEPALALTRNATVPTSSKNVDANKRDEVSKSGKSGDSVQNAAATASWFIGVSNTGVVLFASSRATRVFKWEEVAKLTTNGRLFIVHTHPGADLSTSRSFTAGPLAERDENDKGDKPAASAPATNGQKEKTQPNETGKGEQQVPATSTSTNNESVRETNKDKNEKADGNDENHVDLQPADRSATLRSGTSSRFGTLQRNSVAAFRQKFQTQDESEPKTTAYEFRCDSNAAAKSLWLIAVDQQAFFTLKSSDEAQKVKSAGGLFARSAKFRFSGRCERELNEELSGVQRTEPSFERAPSTRIAADIRNRRATSGYDKLNSSLSSSLIEQKVSQSDDSKRSGSATDSAQHTNRGSTDSHDKADHIVPTVSRTEVRSQPKAVANASGDEKTKKITPNHGDRSQDEAQTCSSGSCVVVTALSKLLLTTIVVLAAILVFLTLLYETDFMEKMSKNLIGLSLRKNAVVEALAKHTYTPIKQFAASLFYKGA